MCKFEKVYARALDPVHVGTGGYRLGRVDNTIVRDPATDVPKIPGTSIAGIVRAFAEVIKKDDEKKNDKDKKLKDIDIEVLFGTETQKGALHFYDGQIIFFPVYSIEGTIWVTTVELLKYWFGFDEKEIVDSEDKAYAIKRVNNNSLNLGWLLLEVEKGKEISSQNVLNEIDSWVKKIVVVSDKLFSHIVNDNLEVRTSVRIDRETGTAAEKALFTYEAIPRGTVFGFEICLDKIRNTIPDDAIKTVMKAVKPYLRNLGIGGMGTRGFGRLEVFLDEGSAEGGKSNAQS